MRMAFLVSLVAPVALIGSAAIAQEPEGYWDGTLEVGAVRLPVGVRIERSDDGSLTGSLDSPSQGSFDIPIEIKQADGEALVFTVPSIGGRYEAVWQSTQGHWAGVWSQGGQPLPLALSRGEPPDRSLSPPQAPLPDKWTIPSKEAVDSILEERIAGRPGAGFVLGIVEDGETRIISAGGDGFSAETIFEIGSLSKVFTALLLAQMVLEGKVSLDDPVAQYLPDGSTMPTRDGRQITLRNLSHHDSGLPRLPDNLVIVDGADPYADYSESDLLEFLERYELPREIGSKYEYSNLGVGLLGYALARIEGTDFETLLERRLLKPLGMEDTGINLSEAQMRRFAVPHDGFMQPTKPWDLSVLAAAGGIRSSAADMQTFLKAVLDPASSIADAVALSLTDKYEEAGNVAGLGWGIVRAPTGIVAAHSGGTGGFRSHMAVQPRTKRGAVLLTNSAVEPSAQDINLHVLLGAPLAETRPVPKAPETASRVAIELTTAQLERVVGTYRFTPGLDLSITRREDQLLATVTGQSALPIFAASPAEFFYRAVNATILFTEEGGEVTGATFVQDGRIMLLTKVE